MSKFAMKLESLWAAQAKERQRAGGVEKVVQKSGQAKTDHELAAIAGVSHDTIARAEVIAAPLLY